MAPGSASEKRVGGGHSDAPAIFGRIMHEVHLDVDFIGAKFESHLGTLVTPPAWLWGLW
jgi:hypothetical protein